MGCRIDLDDIPVGIKHIDLRKPGKTFADDKHVHGIILAGVFSETIGFKLGYEGFEVAGVEGKMGIGIVDAVPIAECSGGMNDEMDLQASTNQPCAICSERRPFDFNEAKDFLVEFD